MEKFIIFNIGKQEMAMKILNIERILEYIHPEKMPDSPNHILGVIKYNEKIIPVIDLKKVFYNENTIINGNEKMLIVQDGEDYSSLLVEDITGIKDYGEDNINKKTDNSFSNNHYIDGFIKEDEKIIIVIDINKIKYKE